MLVERRVDPLRRSPQGSFFLRRILLTGTAVGFLSLFVILPLVLIFAKAFSGGLALYWRAVSDPLALSAIGLTALAAGIAVPLNLLFGLCAAWAIAKFDFLGKGLLTSLIDLPFSVSPVIAGMIYVLVFGLQTPLGRWLDAHGLKVVFGVPGIVLATLFVTFPFVARELIGLMQEQGSEEEEAAVILGAGAWAVFWRVTLPNVKWGILYGVTLSVARAVGEFGAVSVVSGHIRGRTNTVTLHIENLYNEYQFPAAFALASVLTLLAVVTLALKKAFEGRAEAGVPDPGTGGAG